MGFAKGQGGNMQCFLVKMPQGLVAMPRKKQLFLQKTLISLAEFITSHHMGVCHLSKIRILGHSQSHSCVVLAVCLEWLSWHWAGDVWCLVSLMVFFVELPTHRISGAQTIMLLRVTSSWKSPACAKRFPFENYGGHYALGNFQCSRIFF